MTAPPAIIVARRRNVAPICVKVLLSVPPLVFVSASLRLKSSRALVALSRAVIVIISSLSIR